MLPTGSMPSQTALVRALAVLLPGLLLVGACASGTPSPDQNNASHDGGPGTGSSSGGGSGSGSGGSSGAGGDSGGGVATPSDGGGGHVDSGTTDAGSDAGSLPAGTAMVRVHYPAGTHTVTVRGSAAGLNWTTGKPTTASGDTFTYTLTGVTATLEWKPLLDDTTWAIGPELPRRAPARPSTSGRTSPTMTGQVTTLIADFHSTVLGDDRAIYAYLPASYAENTDATYPVVYMHDGQNLWAALPQLAFSGTWNVDTAFDTASQLGACSSSGVVGWGAQPLGGTPTTCNGDSDCTAGAGCATFPEAIVIGVANNANRVLDYTPTVDPSEADAGSARKGAPTSTSQMLVTELKPKIDGDAAHAPRRRLDRDGGQLARRPRHGVRGPEAAGRLRSDRRAVALDVVGQRRHRDRRDRARRRRPRARSSSTSTRGRARSTTRRTPTCSPRRTSRSATSTDELPPRDPARRRAQRDVLGRALPGRDAARARSALTVTVAGCPAPARRSKMGA